MVDVDGDRVVDYAYVGDLFGNMWKFDLRSTNPAEWDFAFGTAAAIRQPFFVANDGRWDATGIRAADHLACGSRARSVRRGRDGAVRHRQVPGDRTTG